MIRKACFLILMLCTTFALWAQKPTLPTASPTITPSQPSTQESPALPARTIRSATPIEREETATDTVKKPRLLTDIVKYKATDYQRMDLINNTMTLYNEAEVIYGEMKINAGKIVIDNKTNNVYAYGITDTSDVYQQRPVFNQANNSAEPDSLVFNIKTRKAITYNTRTEEAGIKILSKLSKRVNDSTYYASGVRITTSKNEEDPEYYFYSDKIKYTPDSKVVSGPIQLYIQEVPTPLIAPFIYFPLTDTRKSGFLIPSFGENNQRGYFLQNGGYYFAISDYIDLAVTGDYYTNGSYALRFDSSYAARYKYRGSFSARFETLLNSERGFPDFSRTNIYNIRWTHAQDAGANPSSRFSASVNLGSSEFFRQSVNQVNTGAFLNNNLSSSVSYSKTIDTNPQININLAATHNQNTNTRAVNLTLPTLQASVARVYPFAKAGDPKRGIIKNVNLQYNLRAENRIQTTDEDFFTERMFDNARLGAQHSIPIATNFKVARYFSVTATANLNETWVGDTIERSFDPTLNENVGGIVRDTVSGFDRFATYNFNASIGTTIYGNKNFGDDKKIQAIRHTIRPSVTYNINPGFDQSYQEIIDADGNTVPIPGTRDNLYSRFEGGLFGAPGRQYTSSIGLSVQNNLEAKVRDRDSTKEEGRKIFLLKNLTFSTSYNIAGDSLRISPVSVRGAIPVTKGVEVNFNAALDPYALDRNNRRIERFNIDNGGSLFRLTRANASFSYSINNEMFKGGTVEGKERIDNENLRSGARPDDLFGRGADIATGGLYDDDEDTEVDLDDSLYNFGIPWDLRLAYTVTYNNSARQNEITSHSLMFSGDVELSPRWTVGVSSGYDIANDGFTFTQFRFQRDLESWRMSLNWVPQSTRASWYFFIGIKSSALSDIKWDKRREPDRNLLN